MLTIRAEQMDAFRGHMRTQYEQRMAKHLREKFPDRTEKVDDKKMHTIVKQGIDKAEGYGIEYEDDIRQFLEYLVIYGPHMDSRKRTKWIGDILRRQDLDGTRKMKLIDETELTVR